MIGVTYSEEGTPPKITLLSVCLGENVAWGAVRGVRVYYHIDANAGSGARTGDFKLNGMPIRRISCTPELILRKAHDKRWQHLRFDVTLVERNRVAINQLGAYLDRKWPRFHPGVQDRVAVKLVRGDNTTVLGRYAATVADPDTAFGSILLRTRRGPARCAGARCRSR